MSLILAQIIESWKSKRPSDPGHVLGFYVNHPDKIGCFVAQNENGSIVGFQSLKRAARDNPYGVSPGWGIIGTYVAPQSVGRGIGSKLFARSREAARASGLTKIDATIGKTNAAGLAYYEAMGFHTYRTGPQSVSKCLGLE